MKSNLSVLGLVPEDGAMAKIIKEGKCGYILPYDENGMLSILGNVLSDYKNRKVLRARPEFVSQFSSDHMVNKLAERIEKLTCKK